MEYCLKIEKKTIEIGGQAVIEGVMMRGPEHLATAVRRKDKTIEVIKEPFTSVTKKKTFLGLPVIRGFVSLVEMLIIGFKSLNYSASRAELDWVDESKKITKSDSRKKTEEIFSYILAFGLAFLLFVYLPYQLAYWIKLDKGNIYFNLFSGAIRILFFVIYVWIISQMKDIKRIFQYHGAEHKSVYAYENNSELTSEDIQKFSTRHPRCGTSFIFIVLLIAIAIFSIVDTLVVRFWGAPQLFIRLGYHFLLMPFISGISYEILKLSSKNINHPLVRIFTWPGLSLQRITTQPPNNEQIEVAVVAMKCALNIDFSDHENVVIIPQK